MPGEQPAPGTELERVTAIAHAYGVDDDELVQFVTAMMSTYSREVRNIFMHPGWIHGFISALEYARGKQHASVAPEGAALVLRKILERVVLGALSAPYTGNSN